MNPVLPVFKREFLGYFRTPVAYVFLAVFLLASVGLAFFVSQFFKAGNASLESFFFWHTWLFVFFAPAAGMRLWAEERRSGTPFSPSASYSAFRSRSPPPGSATPTGV
jgi:ABC-2 type transport system permease protein